MKSLAKKDLIAVLRDWSGQYTVLCPNKMSDEETVYDVFDEKTFTLEYTKPSMPPKSAYLPQSDVIFAVENNEYRPVVEESPLILFGIRPCDMTGILQSRSFMTGDMNDPFYRARSDNTLSVVIACEGPQNETCFCTTTRSGPSADKGYDLQFYSTGDSFLVEIGSEKGSVLTESAAFTDVDETCSHEKIRLLGESALQKIPPLPQFRPAMERLSGAGVTDEFWDLFARKCIVCGGCTFVCPTCTCFNVFDRKTAHENGERIRTWDACLYSGFTKEASGHNPRSTQGLRLKRRYEHKLLYFDDRDTHGSLCTCVGCGRCSDYCPVHIGTIEIVRAIAREQS